MLDLAPGVLTMIVLQLSAMRKNMLIQLYNNICDYATVINNNNLDSKEYFEMA
jgi:hypothetical protein